MVWLEFDNVAKLVLLLFWITFYQPSPGHQILCITRKAKAKADFLLKRLTAQTAGISEHIYVCQCVSVFL